MICSMQAGLHPVPDIYALHISYQENNQKRLSFHPSHNMQSVCCNKHQGYNASFPNNLTSTHPLLLYQCISNPEHKSNAASTATSSVPTRSFNPLFSALKSPTVSQATELFFPRKFSHPVSPKPRPPYSSLSPLSVSPLLEFELGFNPVRIFWKVDVCWAFGGRGFDVFEREREAGLTDGGKAGESSLTDFWRRIDCPGHRRPGGRYR
jgi:curved DNA-binding protein CbpA